MRAKFIGAVAASAVVLILIGAAVIFMSGSGEPGDDGAEITIDEVMEETFDLGRIENVMIPDEGTVYWPVSGPANATEVLLITGVSALISWSDDEEPPASRPMYQNMPDQMILSVTASPFLQTIGTEDNSTQNGTIEVSSRSDSGTSRVDLDLRSTPVVPSAGPMENLSVDPSGSTSPGSSGLYVSVSCLAGHMEASRPALLMYTDRGDEITLTLTITLKRVPVNVFEAWVKEQSRAEAW